MALRIGVLLDPFDPIQSGHLASCAAVLSSGEADRVLLVPEEGSSCSAPSADRWQMLVSACAGSKDLIPLHLSPKHASSRESVIRSLRRKHPKDKLFFLSGSFSAEPIPYVFSSCGEPESLCPPVLEYCMLKGLYGAVSRLDQADEWIDRLFEALNPHRFAHTLSVARASVRLADRFGLNSVQAEQAGLLHDCAKCIPLPEMQRIARKHHLTEDPVILASGSLLHSTVGAWVACNCYGMKDPEVIEAVAYHNTGHKGMSRLAMCVCLADFIEPTREPFPLLEDVRRLAEVSLEKALLLSLEGVADHVRSKGKLLHPRTLDTIQWLKSLPSVQSDP